MLTIKQALDQARPLQEVSESWQLDAELLLAAALGANRTHLFTWPEQQLLAPQLDVYRSHCQRRQQGEPIAYILGTQAFWDFDLLVNSRVLIPRPETELLVEIAIELLHGRQASPLRILDLGTGSGAIALALARCNSGWRLTAVDRSEEALQVARLNAEKLKVSNIEFRQASWCAGLEEMEYDMIVANPPYVAPDDEHLQKGDIQFEPLCALVAAENGLADIREIAAQASQHLKKEAWLLIEHGYNQKEEVAVILRAAGYSNIQCYQDIANIDRMSVAQLLDQ